MIDFFMLKKNLIFFNYSLKNFHFDNQCILAGYKFYELMNFTNVYFNIRIDVIT